MAGSGNDTISGLLTDPGGQQTFQSWDTIDGGAGINTLNVQNNGANVISSTLANIQRLNFQDTTNGGALVTLSLNGLSSLTNMNLSGNGAASGYAVFNLGSLPTVNLTGTAVGSTFNFTEAALAPTGQSFTVTLNSVTAPVGNVLTLSDVGNNALETVNLVSATAANTLTGLTTTNLGVTTLNISGSQNLTLGAITDGTAAGATLRTIDASAATGAISLTTVANVAGSTVTGGLGNDTITSGSAGADSFVGGAGDDTFIMGANFGMTDTIDGGLGTNTISTTVGAANAYNTVQAPVEITNIQRLTITNAAVAATFNANTIAASINEVRFDAGTAGADGITGNAGNFAVRIGDGAAGVLGGALTVTDTGTATSDVLTVSANGAAATNTLAGVALTSTGYETLVVNTNADTTKGAQTLGAVTVTPDAGGTATLRVTGSNQLTTTTVTATGGTINASGMTLVGSTSLGLTMTAGANTATNIVGSGGVDWIFGDNATNRNTTIDAGEGADIITTYGGNDSVAGGAGNDIVRPGAGNDSVDLGAGNDRIIFATLELSANDTIVGGAAGTDVLQYGSAAVEAGATTPAFNALAGFAAGDDVVAAQARVSGFEAFRFENGGAGGAVAVTLSNYTNNSELTTIQLGQQALATNGYTFGNASAAMTNINVVATGIVVGTHVFNRLTDTATDSLTVSNSITTAGGATALITSLTLNQENTVTLTSSQAGNGLTVTTLVGPQLTTLNVTGSSAVTVTTLTAAGLTTLDASTATAAVAVNAFAASNTPLTATGGTGGLTFFSGTGADTITGNTGNDVIRGALGADVINVGSGTDTLFYSAAQAGAGNLDSALYVAPGTNSISTVGMDVVTGMGRGDILNFNTTTPGVATGYTGAAGAALGLVANAVLATNLAALTGTDNAITLVRGTYTGGTTNTFVGNAGGADTLVIYDSNATLGGGAVSYSSIVLVGYVDTSGVGIGGAGGVLTLL